MVTPEVEQTVREMIADVLMLDLDEVQPKARFYEDLGGESLDLLELSFKVEKQWGVRMTYPQIADIPTDANGRLTPESLRELKRGAPYLNYTSFEDDPHKNRWTELITVSALAQLVALAIQEKGLGAQAGILPAV